MLLVSLLNIELADLRLLNAKMNALMKQMIMVEPNIINMVV